MSGLDNRQVVKDLATELVRLRQRGIDHVDRDQDRQRPLVSPVLEKLLCDCADLTQPRRTILRAYLSDRLDDYRADAPAQAVLIQSLYFDADGQSPGPGGATGLLREARHRLSLSDEPFRKLQRQHFIDFATFLLSEPEEMATTSRRRLFDIDRPLVLTAGLIALIYVAAAAVSVLLVLAVTSHR